MEEKAKRIASLINKFNSEGLTWEEELELNSWVNESEQNRALYNKLNSRAYTTDALKKLYAYNQSIDFEQLAAVPFSPKAPVKKIQWVRFSVAASFLVLISVAGYLVYTAGRKSQAGSEAVYASKDVLPGSDKAILYLADSSAVLLDTVSGINIGQQGNSRIFKTGEGSITYTDNKTVPNNSEIQYNRLVTPRAAQFQLVLPDGSKVWLNASSSIRYPTSFTGHERRVAITGEAYFEVVKNPDMPFRVQFDNGQIEVLGTHFNVNTYGDESDVQALLLEGAVKITNTNAAQSVVLKPGQQAAFSAGEKIALSKDADIDEVMAWKDGFFSFDNANLRTILKQMSRWYDLDVDNQLSEDPRFSFKINRTVNISKLLKILQKTSAIKFEITGKTIKVTKGQD